MMGGGIVMSPGVDVGAVSVGVDDVGLLLALVLMKA